MPVSSDVVVLALMHPAGDELGAVAPGAAWHAWTFEPLVVVLLAASAVLYALGVRRAWRSGGAGRGISRAQAAAFAAGWLAVVAALVSPVDAVSSDLFSVHMVQHELLMIVAAPLLVFSSPLLAFLWTLGPAARRATMHTLRQRPLVTIWSALTAPAVVWLLHGIALWVWHLPALYDAAIASEAIHALEHACFFVSAGLFWWGITRGRYGRLGYGSAVLYVFATAMHSGLLGAALTLSPRVWYPAHAATTAAWGLSPLEDQQLAGLIMWIPASLIFIAMGLYYFALWLKESDRRVAAARSFVSLVAAVSSVLTLAACGRSAYQSASAMTGGDPDRGRAIVAKYGCDTCHTIPGVRTATARVGPPLGGVAARVYIAGHVPNTPGNMQDFIRYPHRHDPLTVMPETGVTEQDARDLAAYLYTLR
jgi:putative membrane protein